MTQGEGRRPSRSLGAFVVALRTRRQEHMQELPKIVAQVNEALFALDPLGYAGLPTSAQEQLSCARTWTVQKFPPVGQPHWLGPTTSHERMSSV